MTLLRLLQEKIKSISNREIRITTKGGKNRIILKNAALIRLNQTNYVLENFEDITELKVIQDELSHNVARSDAMLEAIPDTIFEMDSEGRFLKYKESGDKMLLPPDYFLNRKAIDLLPPELAKLTMEKIGKAIHTGEMQVFEYSLEVDNQLNHYEARMSVCGKNRVISIIRNITEQRFAKNANLALYNISRAITTFEMLNELYDEVYNNINTVIDGRNFFIAILNP